MHFGRILSHLSFQLKVLSQAQDKTLPLLERLKFLCISSSNLDEFFEIRVAGLKQKSIAVLATHDLLEQISLEAHSLVNSQYSLLQNELIPSLSQSSIYILQVF
jgi:polyphosphate kinase